MEDIDLYGDLEDPFFFKDQSPQPSNQSSETTDAPSSVEVEEIRQQNEKLTQQNTALKMNISCLYKTARSELERKEAMIERLMARVKKLEATNAEQLQQAQAQAEAQAQTTSTLTEAQLAAAAYYQAQFMLLANSAASTPTADNGAGATVDSNALSEYYRQFLGYIWNDRTPTSSDVEDAGTPLPSDKEDEKEERQMFDSHAGPGEVQMSSDKSKKLKAKGKKPSEGERERRKVKRSRKHKHPSAEDTSSAILTATEHSSATETDRAVQGEEANCHKSSTGQGNIPADVVRINHKVCPSPRSHDQKINNVHQSDNCMETSTNASTHYTTNGISEENNCHSPSKEKLLPKKHKEDQGREYRTVQEAHREMREAQRKGGVQRLRSSSRSPTNSPTCERMHQSDTSNGFMEISTSSHGITIYRSTDSKRHHNPLHSPEGEKRSPNRHREGRYTKEMPREMKKHHIESTDIQGVINDPHRGNRITRSHSSSRSSYSPTSQNVNGQYVSNMLDGSTDRSALSGGTNKAYTCSRANGVSPGQHTPRIEKHSPKRHREDRETNKSHREMNEPHREVREPHRETRRTHRETREEYIEGDREVMETYREMHREMRGTHRVAKEAYRDMTEAHREARESYKGEPQYRETKEAHRHMRLTRRETTEAYRNPRRDIQEPQVETMELCRDRRDRRIAQRETREAHRDRESSGNRRSHSSSQLSSSSRLRSRSPSYDKENISRPPSSSQERRPRGEPMGRSNSLDRVGEDISSNRMSSRKRKLSSSSQSANQHNRKHARRESYQQDIKQTRVDRSSAVSSLESSPKRSDLLASPVTFCPDFDDITAPPTPNANEILPYSTDLQICENSAMLSYDIDAGAKRKMSDVISCPPTPTSELQEQGEDKEMSIKDTERISNMKDSENKPHANLDIKQANEKGIELKDHGDDSSLASENNDTAVSGGGEPKMEDMVSEDEDKKEASDLEEGEITDSDSDSDVETKLAIKKETMAGDELDRCIERRISESYKSQGVENGDRGEQLLDERKPRSSCYGSGRHRPRHSPRPSHHTPLSERRNRHSPPSLRKRTNPYDRDNRVIVKQFHSERHAHCHRSSRHLRSNLPEQIY